MIVIADSSPLIVLLKIGHIDVLPGLFESIVIPPAVDAEIKSYKSADVVRRFAAAPPSWLRTERPKATESVPKLHPGETEAINLAMELRADLLLIDERRGYREALARKINVIGTVGVLERAAANGMLDLKEVFEKLKGTDFWISHRLLDQRLSIFNRQRGNG
ncbi:MAG TPA: DUF3368 domain-containing protein [Tepidisphaeraceae bacterium]|nr:DUF3368 domain-containing protein [Tepidisphaeraceae bacterium]